MSHPRHGDFTGPDPDGAINLDALATHSIVFGTFSVGAGFGPGGQNRILSTARPDLEILVADRVEAEAVCALLNLAAEQLRDGELIAAVAADSADALSAELARLELDAHDKQLGGAAADRQVHHGPAGAAEHVRIEQIREELRRRQAVQQ